MDKIDFTIKLYQRYYIRALFKNNEIIDKFSAIEKFKLKFGSEIKLLLTNSRGVKINATEQLDYLVKYLIEERGEKINIPETPALILTPPLPWAENIYILAAQVDHNTISYVLDRLAKVGLECKVVSEIGEE